MSIWCSWPQIGHDWFGDEPMRGGEVRTYAEGFSNHYPDTTGSHELPASIDLAHAAPWCVTGHNQNGENYACAGCGEHHAEEVGAWLRLGISAKDSLSWWGEEKPSHSGPVHADVVLDEAAVLRLSHDLGEWLMARKVRSADDEARAALVAAKGCGGDETAGEERA